MRVAGVDESLFGNAREVDEARQSPQQGRCGKDSGVGSDDVC
jgi:hypothetical protein